MTAPRTETKLALSVGRNGSVFTKAAARLAGDGFATFPVNVGTKAPFAGTRGHLDASTDPEAVAAMFAEHPAAGVGIACGPSGLIVVDVDPPAGETSLEALEAEYEPLPDTLTVMTPRGGRHKYLMAPDGVGLRPSAGKLGTGIDIRAGSSYVVAPPTTGYHVDDPEGDGESIERDKIAPAPDWLVTFARDTERHRQSLCSLPSLPSLCHAPMQWREVLEITLPTGPRQRHRLLLDLARGLKHNMALAESPPHALRPYVREWFEHAKPHIRTQDFDTTWFDFLNAWERATYPLGMDLAMIAQQKAKEHPMPTAAQEYENPEVRQLVATCVQLQRMQGNEPFSLSCSQVARLLWGDCSDTDPVEWQQRRRKANRWLNGLCADGVLKVAEAGKPGPAGSAAARYRCVLDQ